jgi:hypothetical protein
MTEDSGETVALAGPGGWRVRRSWQDVAVYTHAEHGIPNPDRPAFTVTMDVVADDDGVPGVRSVRFELDPSMPSADAVQLNNLTLGRHFEIVIQREAIRSTTEQWLSVDELMTKPGPETLDYMEARDVAALQAARGVRRRRRKITPEMLAQVLEAYDKGGIGAVQAAVHVSEPYAWKLLRRARKELQP